MSDPEARSDAAGRAELLAQAFAALLGEVVLWDAAGRMVYASPGALRRLGIIGTMSGGATGGDLVGRTCLELPVEPDLKGALHEGVQAALATGKPLARDLSAHLSFRSMPLAGADGAAWAAVTWLRPVVSSEHSPPVEARGPVPWEDGDGLVAAFRANFELADFASSPEVKARMFEPFFTTKPRGQGSGLGLSTVHAVVNGLGGEVEVDSTLGVGTELRVLLPSRRAPETAERPRPLRGGELRGHETILVVEDEAGVRNLVKRVLDGQGYRVVTAREAGEALKICAEVAIDLVLTDVVMPGLGGHALAQRLQARRPTRVLFMSGYDPESPPLAAGSLLRKPFAPQELSARVREALDLPVPKDMSQQPDE